MKPLAIITGYGHGFGRALNERFEKGGYQSIGVARSSGCLLYTSDAADE